MTLFLLLLGVFAAFVVHTRWQMAELRTNNSPPVSTTASIPRKDNYDFEEGIISNPTFPTLTTNNSNPPVVPSPRFSVPVAVTRTTSPPPSRSVPQRPSVPVAVTRTTSPPPSRLPSRPYHY